MDSAVDYDQDITVQSLAKSCLSSHKLGLNFLDPCPVVQRVDNAVHQISHYQVDETNDAIHWIVIYRSIAFLQTTEARSTKY